MPRNHLSPSNLNAGPDLETGPARVLVADDDRVVQALLSRTLRKAGYDVILAANGREALERMESDVGVTLLDLQMPEMDGINCLRRLRELDPNLAAIMVSASEEISDAVEAMRQGAYDYVVKPVAPSTLIPLVEKARQTWLQNRRFRQMEAELERARNREITIAAKIQRTLLLGRPPEVSGLKTACLTLPSQTVDGDFYDFYQLDDASLDVLIGDVMGKGVPAALLGAAVKSECLRVITELERRAAAGRPPQPEAVVSGLHGRLIGHLEDIETFVTLCYARLDMQRRDIRLVDCGHMRTLHFSAESDAVTPLEGVNVPLGLPEPEPFRQVRAPFEPGDVFLFYSDGLTEASRADREMFGEERLVSVFLEHAGCGPEELIRRISEAVHDFAGPAAIEDDVTCVAAAVDRGRATTHGKECREWPIPPSSL
ncbi:MAG: PP2C family protein-serine/threonine phosphatase [Desulfococcaceae bacterium]